MTNENSSGGEATPDKLMEHFRGSGLKSIIVFTVAVHALVLLGSSIPFLWRAAFGADTAAMSEDARIESAVREATASLRAIAEEYNLSPQDISRRFSGGAPRAPAAVEPAAVAPEEGTPAAAAPEREKSAIEKELDVKAEGPAVPPVDEDIF